MNQVNSSSVFIYFSVSDYKRNKLEKEAKKNWDLFYKRNTTKFFKDRHWTKREFEELCGKSVRNQFLNIAYSIMNSFDESVGDI